MPLRPIVFRQERTFTWPSLPSGLNKMAVYVYSIRMSAFHRTLCRRKAYELGDEKASDVLKDLGTSLKAAGFASDNPHSGSRTTFPPEATLHSVRRR
jgi:hypothetical protein